MSKLFPSSLKESSNKWFILSVSNESSLEWLERYIQCNYNIYLGIQELKEGSFENYILYADLYKNQNQIIQEPTSLKLDVCKTYGIYFALIQMSYACAIRENMQ